MSWIARAGSALLPDDALVMLGNVDVAAAWAEVAPPHLQALDSETRVVGGAVLGFVGGGSTRPGAAFFSGRLDEASVYDGELTPEDVAIHWGASF